MKEVDEKHLKELFKYFARRKYTKATIRRWANTVMEFIVFLEENGRTIDDIGDKLNSEGRVVLSEEFGAKDFLYSKSKFGANYLNNLHHALKRFYIGWEKHFPIPNEEFPKVIGEPKRPTLTTEEILRIAESARRLWLEKQPDSSEYIVALRDYAIILLGIDTGARRFQLSLLNIDDFNPAKGTLFIPAIKGGRDTTRFLADDVKNVLEFYVEKRREIGLKTEALFPSDRNDRISTSAMNDRFRIISKDAGVYEKGAGFHVLRRGKVWRMKKAKMTTEEITDAMGWKRGSKQPYIYGTLDQEEVQRKATDTDTIFKKSEESV